MSNDTILNLQERRSVLLVASIFALRMLGIFMILPVLSLSRSHYYGANEQLIGVAVGIYGLFQATFQIPMGYLSDCVSRRLVLLVGLGVFTAGSLWAGWTTSVYGLIGGRILQGMGAIGGVAMALLADSTREVVRTRAMAYVGMTIGLSFVVAMTLGPTLYKFKGMDSIFLCTSILGIAAMLLCYWGIAEEPALVQASAKHKQRARSFKVQMLDLLKVKPMLSLQLGVFSLHANLTACFLVMPSIVASQGISSSQLNIYYGSLLLIALGAALWSIRRAESQHAIEQLQVYAALSLAGAVGIICLKISVIVLSLSLLVYFICFCILEASLPTLVSKYAQSNNKGTALGLYSSAQFLGIFFGGTIGGWLHSRTGSVSVLIFCVFLLINWLVCTRWLLTKQEALYV